MVRRGGELSRRLVQYHRALRRSRRAVGQRAGDHRGVRGQDAADVRHDAGSWTAHRPFRPAKIDDRDRPGPRCLCARSGAGLSRAQLVVVDAVAISVYLEYQGYGYGFFSYLKGYKFKIKSSFTFNAEEGKLTTVRIVGFEKGGLTTELKDRPSVRYDVESSQALRKGTVGEEAAREAADSPEE